MGLKVGLEGTKGGGLGWWPNRWLPMPNLVRLKTSLVLPLRTKRKLGPKGKLRTEIVVDTVRAAPEFLHLTPAEGGWRVVVVDGAETMNRNAANALLKVLEEPPNRAVLILTCAAPGRLPPTVRSRCRLLRLSPLGAADMRGLLPALLPQLVSMLDEPDPRGPASSTSR